MYPNKTGAASWSASFLSWGPGLWLALWAEFFIEWAFWGPCHPWFLELFLGSPVRIICCSVHVSVLCMESEAFSLQLEDFRFIYSSSFYWSSMHTAVPFVNAAWVEMEGGCPSAILNRLLVIIKGLICMWYMDGQLTTLRTFSGHLFMIHSSFFRPCM